MILYAVLAAAIIIADQLAKLAVVTKIGMAQTVRVIPNIFDFVYVKNTGAAFSILSNMTWLLSAISLLFCAGVVLLFIFQMPKNKFVCLSLSMMFAGALGNAIDRVFRGYVVDFIRLSFFDFPVFNIADISITLGAALLIISIILLDKKEKK